MRWPRESGGRLYIATSWLKPRTKFPGIRFARSLVVLHLDPLAPRTPRLPHRRLGALTQLAASTALHMTLVVIAAVIGTTSAPGIDVRRAEPITDQQRPDVRHLVFLAPELPRTGEGRGWRR